MNPNSVSNIPIVKEQKNLIFISTLEPFYPEDNSYNMNIKLL